MPLSPTRITSAGPCRGTGSIVPRDVLELTGRQPHRPQRPSHGSSRGIAGKSDPTSSRSAPSMSTRYLMARRSNTSESYQNRRASSAGPAAAAHGAASGPRSPGASSFQVRPQNHCARVSISGNPPAAWLNASRSDGYFSATPPVIIAAAASDPSTPTPKVATAGPGSRSEGAGIACTNTAIPSRSASAKNSLRTWGHPATPRPRWTRSPPQPARARRPGQLTGRQVGVLQRHRAQGRGTSREGRAQRAMYR
jgi:hypothetical protein